MKSDDGSNQPNVQLRLHVRIPPVDAIDFWKVPNTQFVLITDTFTT
jgi:hypothetical protein